MAPTEAQKRAIEKWNREKVDDLRIRVPKGQREVIREHATSQGETINAFVFRAITEAIEHDNKKQP